MSTTTTNFGLTKPDATDNVDVSVINTNYDLIDTNAAKKANAWGGGELGTNASAATGGAIGDGATAATGFAGGKNATATSGGAVGEGANSAWGGAVGFSASTNAGGGAVGSQAGATSGGAVGAGARASEGGAVGLGALTWQGGAIGSRAQTSKGAAVGENAKCVSGNNPIDAIQLGRGTNSTVKSMQVYGTTLLTPVDASVSIPTMLIPLSLITASYHAASTDDQNAFKQELGIS